MKRPFTLLLAAIIGIAFCCFTWRYMDSSIGGLDAMDGATAAGTAIGVAMALPFAVVSTIATIFCCLGWLFKMKWAALTAGILYAVSMALMLFWFYEVIVQMILCFVAYSKMKKQPKRSAKI